MTVRESEEQPCWEQSSFYLLTCIIRDSLCKLLFQFASVSLLELEGLEVW